MSRRRAVWTFPAEIDQSADMTYWTPTAVFQSRAPAKGLLAGILLLAASMPLLPGCTGSLFTSKVPAPQVYVLTPPPQEAPAIAQPSQADLVLSITSADPGLFSEHITALRPGRRLDTFNHALWGSSAPRVLQAFLITSLQHQGRFRSVISDDTRVAAPYVVDTDLRDFQAEYGAEGAAPTVRITIVALVMRVKDRALIKMIPLTATARADGDRLGSVVEAFEKAATQVAGSLGEELTTALQDEKYEMPAPAEAQTTAPDR
jgi:cholesterol transport system auxiliary component